MSEYLGFEPTTEENYFFVSYNSDDSERLTGLLTLLNASGVPLWYDHALDYGDEGWRVQIGTKIEQSQGLVLFITRNLFSKPDTYVKTEYKLAKNKCKKKIFVVLLETIDDSDVPYSMYDWWLDIISYQCVAGWKYTDATGLLKEICRMLGREYVAAPESTAPAPAPIPVSQEEPGEAQAPEDPAPQQTSPQRDVYRASEMLIRLEDSYQANPRHIQTFYEFYRANREEGYQIPFTNDPGDAQDISLCDLVQYFTFFESLYRVVKNGILTIEDVDDCFSDRFFTFIHDPYVQENELYLVSSTYVNIFELYALWKKYHVTSLSSPRKINAFLANEIPDYYLDNETYKQDIWDISKRRALENRFHFVNLPRRSSASGYAEFTLRRLFPRDLREVIRLQNEIVEGLDDDDLFVESTKQEYLESMLIDFCYGLYDGDTLAAVCIVVLNRESPRNFISDFGDVVRSAYGRDMTYIDCLTFDTIQVRKEYTGYGIQSFFLSMAENLGRMMDAQCIMASVSPKNSFSKDNFLRAGYSVLTTRRIETGLYDGKERNVMIKLLPGPAQG